MDVPDKAVNAVELRREVAALRLRVAELEASCETAQRGNALLLRQASELARLGTWEWEPSTDRVTWFGDMFRIYGVRREEFTGRGSDYIEATRADYRALQQRNLEAAWKNGVTEEAFRTGAGPIGEFKELCIVRPDGTECYTLGDAVCIVDADGKPLRMLGITVDITERKRAEEASRDSEEQLDRIFNSSTNGLSFTEPVDGKILNVNDTWIREMGISRSDAIGKTALELGIWANRGECDEYLTALERDGRLREFEATMMVRGVARQFLLNAEFVDLRSGRFLLWELRDITEGKRAEVTLRRYELLARYSRDIVLFVRRGDGRILDANAAALRAYGYDREELLSHAIKDLRALHTRALLEEQMDASDSLGLQFETVHRRKDGSNFAVEVSCVGATIGGVRTLMSVVRDITERKRTEKEIALLKHSIDVHYDAAYWTDIDSRFIYVNEIGCKALGFGSGELVGKTILDVNPQATSERMNAVWDKLRKDGFHRSESIHQRQDGSAFPVEILTSYVQFDGQEYACGFARDITERKRAEAERGKLEAQLLQAQKMESVGRLAGGVAHDFNNMLGVILGNVELAVETVDPAEESLRSNLEEIRKAAERSANLTRQLLAFARKQTVAPKVLDLNETVASMLKMLRRLVGEDVNLVWLPGTELYPVKMDPSQIDQILANLCVNARDAIGGVGKLTIATANSTLDDDYCVAHAEAVPGEYVNLVVNDNGCGMDKATQERLFEPFFTTKELGKGTGLGLATVYGIVKQNNGFIKVTSEPGKGARFEICLPRHVAAKTGPAHADPLTVPVARGHETILVVEDEPAILDMTKRMLARLGYTVLTASTPGEAIRVASAYAGVIHLLMTDVVMPEMNGRDLAKNLLTSFPSLKRLFMSGYTADVIAHQGVLDEGVHFIQKPFSKKDLAARVSEALERG
jgi:two-component system cell cycle sensor histidine kinase/response regulator CckA